MDQEVREPMKNSSIELQVFRFPDSHMLWSMWLMLLWRRTKERML
jgi:hypothetical protein